MTEATQYEDKEPHTPETRPDLRVLSEPPEAERPFFDLESIRRTALKNGEFGVAEAKNVVRIIMGVAEADERAVDPAAYDAEFEDRYDRAMGKRQEFRERDEKRFHSEQDESGKIITVPTNLDDLPDINDYINDVYTQLEETNSPVLSILTEQVKDTLLADDAYRVTMRLCFIMATQDLPPVDQ